MLNPKQIHQLYIDVVAKFTALNRCHDKRQAHDVEGLNIKENHIGEGI